MTDLVILLLVFVGVGGVFLAANLFVGKLIRPSNPTTTKGEIYECGEEAVGSAEVQFDMRFYVVALLFVIFDVEIVFLFPWATVFGTATRGANESLPETERAAALERLGTTGTPEGLSQFAGVAFIELAIFFGILLLGFAYLWKRGDLDWVHSTAGQKAQATE